MDKQELSKLHNVKQVILSQAEKLAEGLSSRREEVIASRKEMWREARIVLRDFDDVADLTIFAEDVARHERQYAKHSEELGKLAKMMECPYFARIDFREDGSDEVEQIYIGRYSLFDDKQAHFHIYDWRAPISGLYYDYACGQAAFTVPTTGVEIAGELTLKRQYQIEKGELIYHFDNDVAIEDEILRQELSKAASNHVKSIVNTIQAAQNRAIRAEEADIIVVGPAGSGKTSVGLHRLAYLLYRHRDSLSSAKVRIFSPSDVFSGYIAGLIPELGEQDVPTLSIHELLKEKTARRFNNHYDMLETDDEERRGWLAQKFSAAFLDALQTFVKGYSLTFEPVKFMQDTVVSAAKQQQLYAVRTTAGNLYTRAKRVIEHVETAMQEYYCDNRSKITDVFSAIEEYELTHDEAQAKFNEEKQVIFNDLHSRLKPDSRRLLVKFLKQQGLSRAAKCLHSENIFFEDALLLLYVDILVGRVDTERNVRHILLDEAQDHGMPTHRILRALYPDSNFTVLADTRQALYPLVNITSTEALQQLYPAATMLELTKSYRSTAQIMQYAAKFIGEDNPDVFERQGTPVQTVNSIAAALAQIPPEMATIGIILSTARDVQAFESTYDGTLRRGSYGTGIMAMSVAQAKGLEFDAVIAPLAGLPPKTKYLVCTRALHMLFVLDEAGHCV
jgi:DNA helicase-2/ATP-dependent DNA helicase PcrA